MKTIYTILGLIITTSLTAQTIVNFTIDSGGTTTTNGNTNILYTIGEVNIQELKVGNITLSEGFINSTLTQSTLNVDEEILNQKISIYPNPTSDFINIKSQIPIISIQLFDVLGKKVLTSKIIKPLNIKHLVSGVYLLKITSEKGKLTKRVIID